MSYEFYKTLIISSLQTIKTAFIYIRLLNEPLNDFLETHLTDH